MKWTYDQTDPALMLWTAAVQRWGLTLSEDARVLELGCAETDFAERLTTQNPRIQMTGVDWRKDRDANGWTFVQGDATDSRLFEAESFDAVVMLGALEHFGLGFYGDPVHDDDADNQTMRNVVWWLKPGGWVYFDVPCNPEYRVQPNRHFRQYAPASVTERLMVNGLTERCLAYSLPEPVAGTWCDEPTTERCPYHYVAVVADKVKA